jgi:SAM-dependent methyltransferase|tara:strand:- start:1415 stop:1990 length:576 start_codon:yes stop_codon:yes gene_type:complete
MRGMDALQHVIKYDDVSTILDVGSWRGDQARFLEKHGKIVKTVDFNVAADFTGNFLHIDFPEKFDCIWCSHTLEHQPNVGLFLEKCYNDLRDGGLLAITVPFMRKYDHSVVDGHLTYWNGGNLLYNIIAAGFDCSNARVKTYADQVSVLVRKVGADLPEMTGDRGEINRLSKFFPMKVDQGFSGHIESLNW